MKKLLVLLFVLMPLLLIMFANVVFSAPPAEPVAFPSLIPVKTLGPLPSYALDIVVDIPDAHLRSLLHDEMGIPDSEDIHKSDLEALTGPLYFDHKDISSVEGIQYCKKVKVLTLGENELSALPDMSGMKDLQTINLSGNHFTSFPSQLFNAPDLETVWMDDNPLTSIAGGISSMDNLRALGLRNTDLDTFPASILSLDLEELWLSGTHVCSIPDSISNFSGLKKLIAIDTGLTELPDGLYTLTNLHTLDLSKNKITSLSGAISGMNSLRFLYINDNKLEALPDSMSGMSSLEQLSVSSNSLYSLPEGIGNSGIKVLTADFNRISSIPESVGDSANLIDLRLELNRLKSLPANFGGHVYDFIDLKYNFIDISSGAPAWNVLTDIEALSGFFLEPQLKPVTGVTALAAPDSITLSWQPGENGSNGAEWNVHGYVVYLYDGSLTKLADLDPSTLTYTHTGLTPSTEYSYRIGVDYHVVDIMSEWDVVTRAYTSVSADTLAATALPATSAEPLPTVSAEEAESAVSAEASAESSEAAPASAPGDAVPPWVTIVIIAVAAAGILGTGVALAVLKAKRPKA